MLVDDNQEYIESLAKLLQEVGYEVDTYTNPWKAIEVGAKKQYDLIVSDYEMPEVNGVKVIETIRNMQGEIRSILLTGYNDEEHELESLEKQVDMFLSKEKTFSVILSYIQKLLTQNVVSYRSGLTKLYSKVEKIELIKETHEVYKNEELVDLTPREFSVLEYFLENKGRKIHRSTMIEDIWSSEISETDYRVVDVHIRRLREKLNILCIVSIRGYGYKWNEK